MFPDSGYRLRFRLSFKASAMWFVICVFLSNFQSIFCVCLLFFTRFNYILFLYRSIQKVTDKTITSPPSLHQDEEWSGRSKVVFNYYQNLERRGVCLSQRGAAVLLVNCSGTTRDSGSYISKLNQNAYTASVRSCCSRWPR